MSSKLKKKEFRLSFKVIFRLALFIMLVFYTINYLSNNQADIEVPAINLIQYLPPKSQQTLTNLSSQVNSFPLAEKITSTTSYLSEYISSHYRQLKVDIINRVAKELVDRINQ